MIPSIRHGLIIVIFSLLSSGIWAQNGSFSSGLLMDQDSGRILWTRAPDSPVIPASLTKIVTLHLAWKAVDEGRFTLDTLFTVPARTSASAMPPGSSLMFLEAGMKVTLLDLMKGLAVDSGNDAAETLAAVLAPDRETFVREMNREAAGLGGPGLVFFDPAGLDPRNTITAKEFGRFLKNYLDLHPQALELIHGLKSFTFPSPDLRGFRTRPITQGNRNLLVGTYPGADGLKTGYLPEAGYHMAATALREGQRLTALVLGVQAANSAAGSRLRAADAARLLDWGFKYYPRRPLPGPQLPPVRVYYQTPPETPVGLGEKAFYPLHADEMPKLTWKTELSQAFAGPVKKGSRAGLVHWYLGGREIKSAPLVFLTEGEEAPWWTGLWDWIQVLLRPLWGLEPPREAGLPIVN